MATKKSKRKPTPDEEEEIRDERMTEDDLEDEPGRASMPSGLTLIDPNDPESHPTNAIVYGQPGSGKTTLAATSPAPIFLDFEQGAIASVRASGNPDARVLQMSSLKDVRRAYKWLASGEHDFQTVVLDPLGELQRLIMEDTLKRYPSTKRQYDDLPIMADWNKALNEAVKLVTAFRGLPMRTLVIAHSEIPEHEEDMVKPLVSGKNFKQFIQGAMDLLAYLYVETDGDDTVRKLQTVSSATVIAKNRGGRLPPVIENPNMTEIFALMEGGGD